MLGTCKSINFQSPLGFVHCYCMIKAIKRVLLAVAQMSSQHSCMLIEHVYITFRLEGEEQDQDDDDDDEE